MIVLVLAVILLVVNIAMSLHFQSSPQSVIFLGQALYDSGEFILSENLKV